jgi:D-beta-D-heptose 7-phosphate kinase/D-beta-D-heptose 1-phosphate adenosyltransferase
MKHEVQVMFSDSTEVMRLLEQGLSEIKIAVVGDVMLDRYYYGEVKRISPEAPVPVTRVLEQKEVLGGAANVAQNLARLGCKVHIVGITGQDEDRQRLCRLLTDAGINHTGLIGINRPTTTKLRVIGGHQQMIRLDFEETGQPDSKTIRVMRDHIAEILGDGVRCLIISDYAKGVCSRSLCQTAIRLAEQHGVPVIVDPKGPDWRKYAGASSITPNLKEMGEVNRSSLKNEDRAVERAAEKARKTYNLASIVVTRSEKGLSLIDSQKVEHIPTRAQEVFDVSGAGDTVIAVLGAAVAAGLHLSDSAQLANLAAGIAVGKLGTYAVSREELLAAVKVNMEETAYLAASTTTHREER